ncbi:putative F-box protein PP2-B12 [Primulina huaijiensis]|uniref:putative F-box protein PP2-B12 n=1 Tax=Primulina huaijiensis TaxID=1492673 RepID=UPI003CC7356F
MAVKRCRTTTICGLPEDCLANVLALTTPKDVCRFSAVASTFRSAADSDGVWERFLPSDYRDIISRSIDGPDSLLRQVQSKKDLYLRLSDHPIIIDSGLKSFKLDKCSGKKCYMLPARDLYIVWGDTRRYWLWASHTKTSFSDVAQLRNVCWFEIVCSINTNMLSFDTNYAAYLVFKIKSGRYEFYHQPAEVCGGIKGLEEEKHSFYLENDPELLKRREDGWMEVELGEYFVKGGEDDTEMSLLEMKGLRSKSDLVIRGVEIRPKECT